MTERPETPSTCQVDKIWDAAAGCRRCLNDAIAKHLDPQTYLAFPTVGVLPADAQRVAYVVVGSEPSAAWVKSRAHALERIGLGLRNLADGPEHLCLQYALERWLLARGEGYYLTDLAKCTVPVRVAARTRKRRYALCERFFADEVDAFSPRAILTIGLDSYRYLRDRRRSNWPPIISLLHFAQSAIAHRAKLKPVGWDTDAPTLADLEAFGRTRQLRIHAGRPLRLRQSHIDLVGAYRAQLSVIARLLRGESIARHEAMVHVTGMLGR